MRIGGSAPSNTSAMQWAHSRAWRAVALATLLLGLFACNRDADATVDGQANAAGAANQDAGKTATWPIPGMELYVSAGKGGDAGQLPPDLPRADTQRASDPAAPQLGTHDLQAQRHRAQELRSGQPFPEALRPTAPRPQTTQAPYAGGGVQVLAPPGAAEAPAPLDTPSAPVARAPEPSTAAKPQPKSSAQGKQGLLWGLRSGNATVFLLGSVHLTRGDIYPLRSEITKAFQSADTLVVEADISDQAKMASMVAAKGMYAAGETIRDHVSASTMRALLDYGDRSGMPMMMLERMKPWLAAMTLQTMELQKLGYASSMGIDAHFTKLAKSRKRILQLESAEEQLNLLSRASPRVQELMLVKAIEGVPKLRGTMNTLMDAWRQGDAKATAELALKGMDEPEFRSLYKTIYLDRNHRMTTAINGFLRTGGTYFVVVGAGHMVGPNGIVDLLRKSGHEVVRI